VVSFPKSLNTRFIFNFMANPNCPKCKGEGRIKERDGTIHPCYDCLLGGYMDQHDSKLKSGEEIGFKV